MVDLNNTTGVLKAMDQEQNRKLEHLNQQLMNQSVTLRQALAACPMPAHFTPAQNSDPLERTNAPDTRTVQALVNHADSASRSAPRPGQARRAQAATTDTYQQPETWGEWNPGRGFKVAKSEKGELNPSVDVYHSPVNSKFGFYVGQLTGPIVRVGVTAFY
jgi:hypothetical protein